MSQPDLRFTAVRRDGTLQVQANEAHLLAALDVGTHILMDRVNWQALLVRKEQLDQQRPLATVTLDGPSLWLQLRGLSPGPYLVLAAGQPWFVLVKLAAQWDTVLLRRSACWQAGEELTPEAEAELTGRLSALAREIQVGHA